MRLLVMVLMVFGLFASSGLKAGEDEIFVAVDRFLYGASVGDASIHDEFWAEELIYTSSNGTRFGKAELMAGMEGREPTPDEDVTVWYHSDYPHVNYVDGVGILNFVLVARNKETGDEERFLNSGVFVFRDMRWQAINWHATRKQD
ncbi:nuclear transport factor 2 family protein [Aliidiomarina indica]|uniref:nuclear transport factor 2 family protein n=1 Tax=Aliidiomarina indica TaxID=2749147 RepID=UPI00188EB698|nr:nuclear transport factor 2 family protein [Aliidiomarina indica]